MRETIEEKKVIALYEYIRDVARLQGNTDVEHAIGSWSCECLHLPKEENDITMFYQDRTQDVSSESNRTLLRVHRPHFTPCPTPDESIKEWLMDGWDAFENGITCYQAIRKNRRTGEIIEKLEEMEEPEPLEEEAMVLTLDDVLGNGKQEVLTLDNVLEEGKSEENDEEMTEFFLQNGNRVNAYVTWIRKREQWVKQQLLIDETRTLFSKLYEIYSMLEKDAQTMELVVSNGFLKKRGKGERVTLLTKRVKIVFHREENSICIEDTDADVLFDEMALRQMGTLCQQQIEEMADEAKKNEYHPLDRNDTMAFFQRLAHCISENSDSRGEEKACLFGAMGEPKRWEKTHRFLLYWNPTFFVRNRADSMQKLAQQIVFHVAKTGEVPTHVAQLVREAKKTNDENRECDKKEGKSETKNENGTIGEEILLAKKFNEEQLEVAKKIEKESAILVQGAPGTGKTHTIANLIGHFAAKGRRVLVTGQTKKALDLLKQKVQSDIQPLCLSMADDSNESLETAIDAILDYANTHTLEQLQTEKEHWKTEREQIRAQLATLQGNLFRAIKEQYKTHPIEFGQETLTFASEESNDKFALGQGQEQREMLSVLEMTKFVNDKKEMLDCLPGEIKRGARMPLSDLEVSWLYKSNEMLTELEERQLECDLPKTGTLLLPTKFEQYCQTIRLKKQQLYDIQSQTKWNITMDEKKGQVHIESSMKKEFDSFDMEIPAQDALDDLKEQLQQFLPIGEWTAYAVSDGKKGGAYKNRWEALTKEIEETCRLAQTLLPIRFGKQASFLKQQDKEAYVPTLQKMKEIFQKKGKVSNFDMLFHREIAAVLDEITIDGRKIQSDEDCDIVLNEIALEKKRDECATYWDELLAPHNVPKFHSLDKKEPEQIAEKWISQIQYYVNWYDTSYMVLREKLERANMPISAIFHVTALDSDVEEMHKMLSAINYVIPHVCDICQLCIDLKKEKQAMEQRVVVLQQKKRIQSELCQNLATAIKEEDEKAYERQFALLQSLEEKQSIYEKRQKLIGEIKKVAPAWANAIKNREGIHKKSTIDVSIQDAWKWKQCEQEIAKINATPFWQWQEQKGILEKRQEEVTKQYAAVCAWYNVMQKIENDASIKQEMQSWRQTVRKIGKGTGKNAPYLKAEAKKLMEQCQQVVPIWIMPLQRIAELLHPQKDKFDVVIVDDANEADLLALPAVYMAKKAIFVGDNEQMERQKTSVNAEKMEQLEKTYLRGVVPNSYLYTTKMSLYDMAAMNFPTVTLREHFRCVPQIIQFSNQLSYNGKIIALRDVDEGNVEPAMVDCFIQLEKENGSREQTKERQAMSEHLQERYTVALLAACMEQPEYEGKTFGLLSLGDDVDDFLRQHQHENQKNTTGVQKMRQLVEKYIDEKEKIDREILCGTASDFQGDERDVVFLSMEPEQKTDEKKRVGTLPLQTAGVGDERKKRYNVAMSRAKDQIWVVHSIDGQKDLKVGDIRKTLLDYVAGNKKQKEEKTSVLLTSLEEDVFSSLRERGYDVEKQKKVGVYSIAISIKNRKKDGRKKQLEKEASGVFTGALATQKTKRSNQNIEATEKVVIACDGDQVYVDDMQIRQKQEQQAVLERVGWHVVRIRGSEFYANRQETIERIDRQLEKYGIFPKNQEEQEKSMQQKEKLEEKIPLRNENVVIQMQQESENINGIGNNDALHLRVQKRAWEILDCWKQKEEEEKVQRFTVHS